MCSIVVLSLLCTCTSPPHTHTHHMAAMDEAAMRKAIVAIMLDATLSEAEKALKRQALMAGKWAPAPPGERGQRGGERAATSVNAETEISASVREGPSSACGSAHRRPASHTPTRRAHAHSCASFEAGWGGRGGEEGAASPPDARARDFAVIRFGRFSPPSPARGKPRPPSRCLRLWHTLTSPLPPTPRSRRRRRQGHRRRVCPRRRRDHV